MELIYATGNPYKIKLAQEALQGSGITLVGSKHDVPEIQASARSKNPQEEVALDKARKLYRIIKKPLVAMDSGLFVESLNGFPGIYTKDVLDQIGMEGLMRLASAHAENKAYTQRTVVYTDGKVTKAFQSRCDGELIGEKRGSNGRDYDFIFYLPKKKKTLAQLSDAEKGAITSPAWRQFAQWFLARHK